jgi:hypothetical protein
MDSALLPCFAARRVAPAMARPGQAAERRGGTREERPKGWPVSAPGRVATLAKGWAIRGEPRLARNADRPTESINITLSEY